MVKEQDKSKEEHSEYEDRLVSIKRVAKVVKGGRRFGFAALVIVGDRKGRIGFGTGKAKEVADAKTKATEAAKKALVRIPLKEGRTLHHDYIARFGAGKVVLRSAPPGTGIIAGGPLRAIFECLGVQDVVAKSLGSSNPNNMVRACFKGLKVISSPRKIAEKRGKKVGEIIGRREASVKGESNDGNKEKEDN